MACRHWVKPTLCHTTGVRQELGAVLKIYMISFTVINKIIGLWGLEKQGFEHALHAISFASFLPHVNLDGS